MFVHNEGLTSQSAAQHLDWLAKKSPREASATYLQARSAYLSWDPNRFWHVIDKVS